MTPRKLSPLALLTAALLSPQALAQSPGADRAVLEACGPADEALGKAAAEVARRRLSGQKLSPDELAAALREAGSAAPWPRSLVFTGKPVDREKAAQQARSFAKKFPGNLPHRCGAAVVTDDQGNEALALVAAPAAARVAPSPRRVRAGAWFTVDASLLVPASGARLVLLGPTGLPRTIPASFHKGRALGRFAVDRPGRWLVQLVADLQQGPLPVAEVEVLGGDAKGDPPTKAPGEDATGADDEATILAKINEARRSEGLDPLALDEGLARLARAHAEAMQKAQTVGHDVGQGDPEQRAAAANLPVPVIGENVARASSMPQAHRSLWASPSHRQNLLSPRFTRAGVGLSRDASGSVWIAQIFGGSLAGLGAGARGDVTAG